MLVFETKIISQRKAIGITMLIITVCAGFALLYFHSSLVVKGNATTTMNHILQSMFLFRTEILTWYLVGSMRYYHIMGIIYFYEAHRRRRVLAWHQLWYNLFSVILVILIRNLILITLFWI